MAAMWTFSFVMFWVWAAAVVIGIWACIVAWRFGVRLPRMVAKRYQGDDLPRVAVIVPIKGVDDDTQTNIEALLEQDYPHYRLVFSVESDSDPVLGLLERMAVNNSRIEIVVAGHSRERGQKIHNQLAAVDRTTPEDEVLAFMDADAKPGPEWVRSLVTPLTFGPHIGATTGYRYYIPITPHTANKIVSVLNAQVGALLGPYRRNFAWGGSMAMRREDLFGLGVYKMWQNALSDDYVLSYCVKKVARRRIHYVPQCLVASDANFNWASLFEFAVRQYRITKVCEPLVWLAAVGGALLYLSAFSYTLLNVIHGLITRGPDSEVFHQLAMFGGLYTASIVRGSWLIQGGTALLPAHKREIRSTLLWATLGAPWCHVINLVALVGSAFGRTIVWRGITYRMISRTRTMVLRPHAETSGAGADAGHRARAKV
jgi:cellulose synthase/poly-beta-1,6-N-acetylglucosamine synthase-like glycosyltransferase